MNRAALALRTPEKPTSKPARAHTAVSLTTASGGPDRSAVVSGPPAALPTASPIRGRNRVTDPFVFASFYRETSAFLPIRGQLSRGQLTAIRTLAGGR
jgi:hypothetical protein